MRRAVAQRKHAVRRGQEQHAKQTATINGKESRLHAWKKMKGDREEGYICMVEN